MSDSLVAYVPNLVAQRFMAKPEPLTEPAVERFFAAVLFADISGFTALTEGLRESLGQRQGAEALTKYLATVYTALITEIEKLNKKLATVGANSQTATIDAGSMMQKAYGGIKK